MQALGRASPGGHGRKNDLSPPIIPCSELSAERQPSRPRLFSLTHPPRCLLLQPAGLGPPKTCFPGRPRAVALRSTRASLVRSDRTDTGDPAARPLVSQPHSHARQWLICSRRWAEPPHTLSPVSAWEPLARLSPASCTHTHATHNMPRVRHTHKHGLARTFTCTFM